MLTFSLKYALLYWDRCSEYSADRVAAYVSGGPEPVVKTMSAFVSGSSELMEKINREEFLKQAEEFHLYSESSVWNKFLMYQQLINTDHPFTADRAADIVKWCDSEEYKKLCTEGITDKSQEVSAPPQDTSALFKQCPVCKGFAKATATFCPNCGSKLV